MYKLELIVDDPVTDNWGDFQLRKSYKVTTDTGNPIGVFGYIVQSIDKRTTVTVGDQPTPLTTSAEISKFTSQQVNNASDSYFELFPILNGISCEGDPDLDRGNCVDDQFQNGAILQYEKVVQKRRGKEPLIEYYADDEPPTSGTITMKGISVFVPTSEAVARSLYAQIQSGTGGVWKASETDPEWDLSPATPANGLPFRKSFQMPAGPKVVHSVLVKWDASTGGTTTVTSTVEQQAGRRRLTRGRAASKSYRKQRTGTSTRRLRGRV